MHRYILEFRYFHIMVSILCCSHLAFGQTCSSGSFTWDNGSGGGQIFPANSQSESYNLNVGGGMGVTLDIIDPHNRNSDSDSHNAASHPFDSGCNAQGNQVSGCSETLDNISGSGSISDPWDADCSRDFTQTNGVYGLNYLTIWMYSENSDEEVEYRYTFDRPTNITNLRISDIDAIGHQSSDGGCIENRLGNSYQDEIRLVGLDICGNDVPITIQSSNSQPSSQIIIDPLAQTAMSEYNPNQNNNISPDNQNGEIIVNSTKPVTSFSIFYSNGPDDQTWEESNPNQYPWWSSANGATSGISDDHAIRVDGFDICACPELNLSANGTGCEGEAITFNVTSDFAIASLKIDGVTQPGTSSFTVDSAVAGMSYEVIAETANCCQEIFLFTPSLNSTPTAPVIFVTNNVCPSTTGNFGVSTSCPDGSTLEWSADGGTTWSTTVPTWTDGLNVVGRCNTGSCLSPDSNVVTAVEECCPADNCFSIKAVRN